VNKIPIWHATGSAYGVGFGNLATIVGLIGLPPAVLPAGMAAAAYRALVPAPEAMSTPESDAPAH
jgi:hypothetical protein